MGTMLKTSVTPSKDGPPLRTNKRSRGLWQVASTAARSEEPERPRLPAPAIAGNPAGTRRAPRPSARRRGAGCPPGSGGSTPRRPPLRRSTRHGPRRELGEVGGQGVGGREKTRCMTSWSCPPATMSPRPSPLMSATAAMKSTRPNCGLVFTCEKDNPCCPLTVPAIKSTAVAVATYRRPQPSPAST